MANGDSTKRTLCLSAALAAMILASTNLIGPAWAEATESNDTGDAAQVATSASEALGAPLGSPSPILLGTFGAFDIYGEADDAACVAAVANSVVTVSGHCIASMNPSFATGTDQFGLALDTQGSAGRLTLRDVTIDFGSRDGAYFHMPPLGVRGGGEASVLLTGANLLRTPEDSLTRVAALSVASNTALILDSDESGSLFASSYREAGIGGESGSSITINGGTIEAKSSGAEHSMGAGIGGNQSHSPAEINITGGDITAIGYYGAGIGGGYQSAAQNIRITGGSVEAHSNMGAGIGGGINAKGSDITIAAATVIAESWSGAGIGGGGFTGQSGTDILIKDGATITARSGTGAGIGGGKTGVGSHIVIQDSTIEDATSSSGAGIGGGNGAEGNNIKVENSWIKHATSIGGGFGAAGKEIDIIDSEVKVEPESTAAIGGGGGNNRNQGAGSNIRISSSSITATVTGSGAAIGGGPNSDGVDIEITNDSVVSVATKSGAGIGGGQAGDGSSISITESNVNAQATSGAGIGGGYQGNGTDVSITDSMVIAGSTDSTGAAIGGGNAGANNPVGGDGSALAISGSNIEALGGAGAAIGGGQNGSGTDIAIVNDSIVTAESDYGAGIGGGGASIQGTEGADINIADSVVTASSQVGAGIGGGYNGAGNNVAIHSSIVTATGEYGAGVGSGYLGEQSSGNTVGGTFGSPTILTATGYEAAVEGLTVQVDDLAFQYAAADGAPLAAATSASISGPLSLGSSIGDDEVGEYLQLVLPVVTVSWDSGEGLWSNDPAAAIVCRSTTDTAAFPSPETLEVPEGRQFLGWSVDGGQTVADSSQSPCASVDAEVPGDLSFRATFSPVPAESITVTFDANGGSGSMEPQTVEAGTEFVIPDSTFSKEGFKFAGWKDGTGDNATSYSGGAAYLLDHDLVLYAQWESDPGDTDPGDKDKDDTAPVDKDKDKNNTTPSDKDKNNTTPGDKDKNNTSPSDKDKGNTDPGNADPSGADSNTPAQKGASLPVTGGSLTILWVALLLIALGGSVLAARRS